MIRQIYGTIDLLVAFILFFGFSIPAVTKLIVLIVMVIKGAPSLIGDFICKIYGIIDLLAALLVYFVFPIPGIIKGIIIFVLIFKGVSSLI